MYIFISFILSFVITFALSNIYNVFVVLVISFFSSIFLLTSLDTLINGTNVLFRNFGNIFLGLSRTGLLWFIELAPLWLAPIVSIGGGIITAPIWYMVNNPIRTKSGGNVSVKILTGVLIVMISIMFIIGALLLINPLLVYKLIHYGWIIGLYIALPIASLVCIILMKRFNTIKKKLSNVMIITSILLIPLMIVGVVTSMNFEYHISSADEMNAFKNAPTSYDTVFILDNDIDFKNQDVSWFGKKEFKGVFNGKGHTLSNFEVITNCTKIKNPHANFGSHQDEYVMGFVLNNEGIINDVYFKNGRIKATYKGSISNPVIKIGFIAVHNSYNAGIQDVRITNCLIELTADVSKYATDKITYSVVCSRGKTSNIVIDNGM